MDMSILGLKFHYFFQLYPLCFGNTLECVDGHEYLGVSISHDLCYKKHCNKITKKESKTLRLLHHTLSPCSNKVKSIAYQALVWPLLEYTAEAWNPCSITTANRLEHIQCAAFVHHVQHPWII